MAFQLPWEWHLNRVHERWIHIVFSLGKLGLKEEQYTFSQKLPAKAICRHYKYLSAMADPGEAPSPGPIRDAFPRNTAMILAGFEQEIAKGRRSGTGPLPLHHHCRANCLILHAHVRSFL